MRGAGTTFERKAEALGLRGQSEATTELSIAAMSVRYRRNGVELGRVKRRLLVAPHGSGAGGAGHSPR